MDGNIIIKNTEKTGKEENCCKDSWRKRQKAAHAFLHVNSGGSKDGHDIREDNGTT